MLRAESSMTEASVLQGSAQGLIACNQHAVCSEAVLWGAAGAAHSIRLPCCRGLLMHMLHSAMMLTLSCCQLLQ